MLKFNDAEFYNDTEERESDNKESNDESVGWLI